MKTPRNYYQILHVQPDAPDQIIQSSYRTLMQKLNAHPDRGGDASQAASINRAYAVLSNPKKRADYDIELALAVAPAAPAARAVDAADWSERTRSCPFCTAAHPFEKDIPADVFCANCQSPLYLAEQQPLDNADQRKIDRIGKKATLSFCTQWPQPIAYIGVTDNISRHGMMFQTSHKVSVDSIIKIDSPEFQSIAQVENRRQAGNILRPRWHIGVSFITLHFKSSRGVFVSNMA